MERQNGGRQKTSVSPPSGRFQKLDSGDLFYDTVIHGRYEVISRIGSGGMAHVFLAHDRETGEQVAIKILGDNADPGNTMADRFFIEAKAAKLINHPNVIKIKDIGLFKDRRFCVMEYLEGTDLSKELESGGRMTWEAARDIAAQICDAMEAAHANNILHRDLKPANIVLMGEERFVKVLDFGLAKFTDSDDGLTRADVIPGTPSYMAPEQAWNGKRYDHRADIYSLGIIMYEMVCGRPPFVSESENPLVRIHEVLTMHRDTPPRRPGELAPGLPQEAADIIMRTLAKDPADRFQSAGELKEALVGGPASEEEAGPVEEESAVRVHQPEPPESAVSRNIREILGGEPIEDPRRSGGGFFKKAIAAGLIVGAAVAAYHYKDRISGYIHEFTESRARPEPRKEAPPPAPRAQTQYEATIETEPQGATVYDITDGMRNRTRIGTTPIRVLMPFGQRTILIARRGYHSRSATISQGQPNVRLSLRAAPPRPAASEEVIIIEEGPDQGSGTVLPPPESGE
jgi:serine/threonine protein kinase